MNNILLGYIFSILFLLIILGIGELLIHINKSKTFKFIARKIIHISISLEWFVLYYFFGHSYHWIILCGSLFILLLIGHKFVKSISDTNNKFSGSLFYAGIATFFSIICYFIPNLYIVFGMTICVLSFGDGFAGVCGYFIKKYNIELLNKKTLFGSLCAFIFSFLVMILFNHFYQLNISFVELLIISIIFSFVELITPFNLDNITTTIVTICLLLLAINTNILKDYPFSFISIPLIAILIIKKQVLTKGGIIASIIISLSIILSLGDAGFILLFCFFFITTICDFIKKNKKKKLLDNIHKRVGNRDIYQVLAVGLLPAIISILYLVTKYDLFIIIYVSIIAENLADCMASEIGVLSKQKPLDICKMKLIDTGLSGGISLLGSVASLIGITIISICYYLLPIYILNSLLIIIISALIGVFMDSVLGSLIQRKNKCLICEKITEKDSHCDNETVYYSGIKWINNSGVNFMSNIITLVISIIMFVI